MENDININNLPKGLSIAGLVLGIISLAFCWVPIVFLITGIVGIVLSAIAISKNKKGTLFLMKVHNYRL